MEYGNKFNNRIEHEMVSNLRTIHQTQSSSDLLDGFLLIVPMFAQGNGES